jgi:soluble lytic murein transglycosylase
MLRLKSRSKLVRHGILISILAIFLLIAGLLIIAVHRHIRSNKYNALIIKYARQYSIDPNLIKAVIWRESNFDVETEGSKGEIGLMQIIPSASVRDWATYNKRPAPPNGLLFSSDINIGIGTWYLAKCRSHWIKYKNSTTLALAEYNAGYTNAKKWTPNDMDDDVIDRIKFPSTKDYVIDILRQYEEYKVSKDSLNIETAH